jgi:hypothetical protein
MKAKFDYTFQAKDQKGNPIIGENGKPVYKAYYALSGSPAELQAYIDWRTNNGWQVKYNDSGAILMSGRASLDTDTSSNRLYNVKSGELKGKFQYWVDHSDTRNGIASISAADYYGDADFTAEVRRQVVAELRGSSISNQAMSAIAAVAASAPANLNEPIGDTE